MPRQETEILAFYMLERLKGCKGGIVLDLCTGSGCLGLSIKKNRPDMHVILSDISPLALACARKNAALNGLEVEILEGDLLGPLGDRKVDYVVCNPPYVSDEEYEYLDSSVRDYEPKIALVGGREGLDFYARLSKDLKKHLNLGGKVFLEIGKDQGAGVMRLFADWDKKEVLKDFAGHDRFFFLMI
ncbi:MAG: peptide chain release factor N(5)-glutamine methyltransferase, partial [Chlamydiae bacterium]|nr:peptide chain release factor N(5)-glutamine methyltransferase [Chlamydiota bacterium]